MSPKDIILKLVGSYSILITNVFNILAVSKFVETYLWDNSSQYYLLLFLSTTFFILELIESIREREFKFTVIFRYVTTILLYTVLLAITYWVVINIPLLFPLQSFLYTIIIISLFISVLERIDSFNIINPLNISLVREKINEGLSKIGISKFTTQYENQQLVETALTEIMLSLVADGVSINVIEFTSDKDNPFQLSVKYQIGDIGYENHLPYTYTEWNQILTEYDGDTKNISVLNIDEFPFLEKINMNTIVSMRIITNLKDSIQPFIFLYFKNHINVEIANIVSTIKKHLSKFENVIL